jgi:hypothetical protein
MHQVEYYPSTLPLDAVSKWRSFAIGLQLSRMSLCEWYANRAVLLTGVTSELGRALLEKILRHLPDVTVYIVLRSRNGLSKDDRLKKIFASPRYEHIPPRTPLRVYLVPVNRAGRSISLLWALNCDRDSGRGRAPNLFPRTSNQKKVPSFSFPLSQVVLRGNSENVVHLTSRSDCGIKFLLGECLFTATGRMAYFENFVEKKGDCYFNPIYITV